MNGNAKEHLWTPLTIERTAPDLWEMSDDGLTVYVDVAALWNGPDEAPDDQPFGHAAIRLDWRDREDGKPWTAAEYAAWLQNGAKTNWDGDARLE